MIHKDWKIDKVDNENIEIMLSYPIDYYQNRLLKIGFAGKKTIMFDAGCGAGHWAVAGTYLNHEVYGLDLTAKYLKTATEIKNKLKSKNLDLKIGRIEKLPYRNNFFDSIICYSVWMFVEQNISLKEFYRVLKPNGKLYLGSLTGPAWYPKLIIKGFTSGSRNLILSSIKAILHGIPLSERKTRRLLEQNNFQVLDVAGDGQVGDKKIKIKPIYNHKLLGFWEIYEVLAIKK